MRTKLLNEKDRQLAEARLAELVAAVKDVIAEERTLLSISTPGLRRLDEALAKAQSKEII
jgi:hypothetical protein